VTATGYTVRQVFDLPEPQPLIVTEHRAHRCRCAACGTETRAAFPEGVTAPAQYGARIAAFVVYLLHYQLLPEKRLAELMADLFAVNLVTATIASMSRTCATRFQDFAVAVRDCVAAAPVKHLDETGFRIGGKTQWLHIASTILLTFYRISPKPTVVRHLRNDRGLRHSPMRGPKRLREEVRDKRPLKQIN
jgi:transposase